MNDNMKKCLKALRSGNYQQTKGVLHDAKGYCCLGVFCDQYRLETGEGEWLNGEFILRDKEFVKGEYKSATVLPLKVQKWLNMKTRNGSFILPDNTSDHLSFTSLTEMNDENQSFMKIARMIESDPKELFLED